MDHTKNFIDGGNEFLDRHRDDNLSDTQMTWGAVTWGLLRAFLRCDCGGMRYYPNMALPWYIRCPQCGAAFFSRTDYDHWKETQPEAFEAWLPKLIAGGLEPPSAPGPDRV